MILKHSNHKTNLSPFSPDCAVNLAARPNGMDGRSGELKAKARPYGFG